MFHCMKGGAMTTVLDPTAERSPAARPAAARPASTDGLTVGLLDISKPRGDLFMQRLGLALAAEGIEVKHYQKPTFTKPAPDGLRQEIAEACDLMVEGLAD
jgi:hypothetical protein